MERHIETEHPRRSGLPKPSKDVYQCVGANGIGQYEAGDDAIDPPVEEEGGVIDDLTPGFGIVSVLLMLAGTAVLSRRRIQD